MSTCIIGSNEMEETELGSLGVNDYLVRILSSSFTSQGMTITPG